MNIGDTLLVIAISLLLLIPALFSGLRNARGIFTAYAISGAIIPIVAFFVFGVEFPNPLVSLRTDYFELASVALAITIPLVLYTAISISNKPDWTREVVSKKSNSLSNIYTTISIVLGLVFMITNIFVLGGFDNFIRTYFIRISINDSIINYTSILYYGSVTFIVFAFYHNAKSNWYRNFYLMFGLTFTLILSSFMGGRSLIVILLLSLGYHWVRKLKTSKATLSIALAGIAVVFISYIIIDLRYQTQNSYYYSGDKGSGIEVATTGVVFADHVAASIEYAERKGHDYGALYRNLLLLPIPRSVWPEKPRQISVEMRDFIFQDVKGGIPPGIFGESYIAFGYPGMIAASLLLGLFLGLIDRRSKQADRTLCATTYATTAVMGPLVAFSLVRGGFDVGLMRVGIPLFWCMVAARIARILAESRLQSRRTTDATMPPAVLRRREALSARSGISASQL